MKLNNLSQTFLTRFFYSQEPFAIIKGRLYTLVRGLDSEIKLYFLDEIFGLEESEEISQLEKQLFLQEQDVLERRMSKYILNIVSKFKTNLIELKELGNIYQSLKDTSIERFIMVDVFNAYNHENHGVVKEVLTSEYEKLPEIQRMPTVRDLFSRDNSLDALIESCGIFVFEGLCYKLVYNDNSNDWIDFRDLPLYLKPWIKLEELCMQYSKSLNSRIKKKAEEHAQDFSHILSLVKKEKTNLRKAINQNTSFSGRTSGSRGHISFRKKSSNIYEIRVNVPPYIIGKSGYFYAFSGTVLGLDLKIKGNEIMLKDKPKVVALPYKHPFVYLDGNICYGNLNWAEQRKIIFGQYYDMSNKTAIAKKIAQAMREGERTLLKGYIGNNVDPVNNIDSCDCQVGASLSNAKTYALRHNIPLERIIENH